MSLKVNQGTQTDILSYTNAGTEIPAVKLDVGVGTAVADWGGTIPTVANLLKGTVNAGTIQSNMTPTIIGTSTHTRGTSGAAAWGTLVAAAGAGTRQYISGVDIVVTSGTVDIAVTNIGVGGSTGAGVLARGQFTPGGGIRKAFNPVAASATNGTLAFWMGGAGTVDIVVDYWQGV